MQKGCDPASAPQQQAPWITCLQALFLAGLTLLLLGVIVDQRHAVTLRQNVTNNVIVTSVSVLVS